MKCSKCGYESYQPFTICPSCKETQPFQQQVYVLPTVNSSVHTRSAGEKISIGVGIAVSAVSLITAFIVMIAYSTWMESRSTGEDSYGIDAYDDEDSNEYEDEIENFFEHYYKPESGNDSSTDLNQTYSYKETLYSFSEGEIETEYEVSMVQTYRGEAAVKLLEGETLPTFDEFSNDIYLVKFKIVITGQDKDAIVPIPQGNPCAYREGVSMLLSQRYDTIDGLSYANRLKLIKKGDEVETWMAFIVSKNDQSPCIRWNINENKVFRNSGQSITDPQQVESGAAVEPAKSETESDDLSSD